jgi:glycosyltransferase involved in cell wall biosynthesis
VRVLRVYHGGRSPSHRARERALKAGGIHVTLAVPSDWPERGEEARLHEEDFPIVELPVARAGDVNRHAYRNPSMLAEVIADVRPNLVDIHEEPFSVASRQWLAAAPPELPVVMYTAQNVDKRFPPPFSRYETRAHRRVAALYPCSRQAASVARGKGFAGLIQVIPLGYDPQLYSAGDQSLNDQEVVLGLFGRLVREKGVCDAVRLLARVSSVRPARLIIVGTGPEEAPARNLAVQLGVEERLQIVPWAPPDQLAAIYRQTHVVLVPSVATTTWVEQFGRVIVEAQASGAVVAGYESGSIADVAGKPAALVPENEVGLLGDRLAFLLSESGEYQRRRAGGLALAQTRRWADVARQQTALYRRVASGDLGRMTLPRARPARRSVARREFGATANTIAGERPFAVPVLRHGGAVARALARSFDMFTDLRHRLVGTR